MPSRQIFLYLSVWLCLGCEAIRQSALLIVLCVRRLFSAISGVECRVLCVVLLGLFNYFLVT